MILRILLCAAATFVVAGCTVKAKVADVSGQSYDVTSMRLAKGSKLKVVCGETRMNVPFGKVSNMKIDPKQITSVDGRPYLGVEIRMRDGTVIGDITERGKCLVCADNGLTGKIAKAGYSAPLSSLSGVEILGKDDAGRARSGDDDDDEDDED